MISSVKYTTLGEYDTPKFLDECPICGAGYIQECSEYDYQRDIGIELGNVVHSERILNEKENYE